MILFQIEKNNDIDFPYAVKTHQGRVILNLSEREFLDLIEAIDVYNKGREVAEDEVETEGLIPFIKRKREENNEGQSGDLKKWKEFSDLVDEHNKKEMEDTGNRQEKENQRTKAVNEKLRNEGNPGMIFSNICLPQNIINKSEINYLEWLVGKLKL